jgi:hypothetical protein
LIKRLLGLNSSGPRQDKQKNKDHPLHKNLPSMSLPRVIHASRKTHDILGIEARPWRSDSSLALGIPDFTSQISDFILRIVFPLKKGSCA